MYNLLIVDDEKIIRDGIYELLSMEDSLELNLLLAASAVEAIDILENKKVDIILTDIQMPKMTGIELMKVVLKKWPFCKVIFLTGYSDFDYVYEVHEHARYILKAEEDEKIIGIVKETLEDLENDFLVEKMVEKSNALQKRQLAIKRLQFLWDLFNGYANLDVLHQELFDSLEIQLHIDQPIYYGLIKYDYLVKDNYDEQLQVDEELQVLMNNYYFDFMDGAWIQLSKNYVLILLQPRKLISQDKHIRLLKHNSELFQKACLKNFDMSVSIALQSQPMPLKEVISSYPSVKGNLLRGEGQQVMVISDEDLDGEDQDKINLQQKNSIQSRLELLDYYFENSDQDHVHSLILETMELFKDTDSIHDLFAVEVYSDIAVKLLKYINQFHLSQEICFRINVYNLYNVTLHDSWTQAFNYLMEITSFIFEIKRARGQKHNDDVIDQIKKYIHSHLDSDTSLDRLADIVNLSPEYLLRLFKKSENITILQYINDLKIIKAKKMIDDQELQIKEIAKELGFNSSGYFGRFFKHKTGYSPQCYRDLNKTKK